MRRTEKIRLVREIIGKKRPDLLPLAKRVGIEVLTDKQLETLRDVVIDVFLAEGLQEDDEPNAKGIILDDAIDFLVASECNPGGEER